MSNNTPWNKERSWNDTCPWDCQYFVIVTCGSRDSWLKDTHCRQVSPSSLYECSRLDSAYLCQNTTPLLSTEAVKTGAEMATGQSGSTCRSGFLAHTNISELYNTATTHHTLFKDKMPMKETACYINTTYQLVCSLYYLLTHCVFLQ